MLFAACDRCGTTFAIDREDACHRNCPECHQPLRVISREEGLSRVRERRGRELSERCAALRQQSEIFIAASQSARELSRELRDRP